MMGGCHLLTTCKSCGPVLAAEKAGEMNSKVFSSLEGGRGPYSQNLQKEEFHQYRKLAGNPGKPKRYPL